MKRTIIDAIKKVMRDAQRPLTVVEVYDAIIGEQLYNFKAENPQHVVRSQIRRHAKGVDIPSGSDTKHFEALTDGTYVLLSSGFKQLHKTPSTAPIISRTVTTADLEILHRQYLDDFKKRLLEDLKKLDPYEFERFCKNLLNAYGFRELIVTPPTKDGGIDGYGKLKVGFAYFNVAFQCKRWTKNSIGSPEINQFRGSIQGKFEQGMFFTTGKFSDDAKKNSFQPGAVTIILIDGPTIVEFMIESRFGVEVDNLPIYSSALDNALSES